LNYGYNIRKKGTPIGICKDYEEDCKEVKDHFKCWLGSKVVIDGEGYECDTSNGLCPFIHHCN